MRKLLLALFAGLIAASAATAEPVTIRIAFSQVGAGGRQFAALQTSAIAHARGFVQDEFKNDPDIKIQWLFFRGAGPATNEAAANGQIDFFSQGDLPSIIGRAVGLKTRLLLSVAARQTRYLAASLKSDVQNIKDIRSRQVAYHHGTNITLSIPKILAVNGLTDSDVRFINMDDAGILAALVTGDIDGAFGTQQLLDLEQRGAARIVYSTKNDSPKFTSNSAFFVTDKFEQKHPELTYRVVKAPVKAAAWASDEANREAVFETWAQSGVPASIYRDEFAGQAVKYRNSPLVDEFLVNLYEEQVAASKKFGFIKRDVDVDGWIEPKYLQRALTQLKLDDYWDRYDADGNPIRTSK